MHNFTKKRLKKNLQRIFLVLSFYNPFKVLKKDIKLKFLQELLVRFFFKFTSSDEFLKKYPIVQEHKIIC